MTTSAQPTRGPAMPGLLRPSVLDGHVGESIGSGTYAVGVVPGRHTGTLDCRRCSVRLLTLWAAGLGLVIDLPPLHRATTDDLAVDGDGAQVLTDVVPARGRSQEEGSSQGAAVRCQSAANVARRDGGWWGPSELRIVSGCHLPGMMRARSGEAGVLTPSAEMLALLLRSGASGSTPVTASSAPVEPTSEQTGGAAWQRRCWAAARSRPIGVASVNVTRIEVPSRECRVGNPATARLLTHRSRRDYTDKGTNATRGRGVPWPVSIVPTAASNSAARRVLVPVSTAPADCGEPASTPFHPADAAVGRPFRLLSRSTASPANRARGGGPPGRMR